jgi:hypothetical protein
MWNHQPDHHWVPMISPWYPHSCAFRKFESLNASVCQILMFW